MCLVIEFMKTVSIISMASMTWLRAARLTAQHIPSRNLRTDSGVEGS